MNSVWKTLAVIALSGLAGTASAAVNIVYPIDGRTYPIADPGPGVLQSAYFTTSFSVTCGGGGRGVKWGVNNTQLGQAKFYDQLSEQQGWKLPGGKHVFWVNAGRCGSQKVRFKIGN